MTFQTAAPLTHNSLHAFNRSAREVARSAFEGETDVNAPYQRPSVWTRAQRIGLVRSWLTGIPVPAIMVNNRATPEWTDANGSHVYESATGHSAVVDGKQRVETAVAWFFGDLAVPASWFNADDIDTTVETDDGPYVTYAGLTTVAQRHMSNRAMLPTVEAQVATIAEEADLFVLVNGAGTPQTDDDMDNAARHSSEM